MVWRNRSDSRRGIYVVDISEIVRPEPPRESQPGRRANLARHRRGHVQRLVFESNLSTPERPMQPRGRTRPKAPSCSRLPAAVPSLRNIRSITSTLAASVTLAKRKLSKRRESWHCICRESRAEIDRGLREQWG